MVRLVNDTISRKDIERLIKWLETHPRLTMGEQTLKFENAWAEWMGVKHCVYVNSGSSANLLMMYTLKYKYGVGKMVIPALSWATDLAPLMQLGIEPVLVDCNLDDLSLDLDHLTEVLEEDSDISAVLLVSVLGLIPNMHRIQQICDKHGVYLIEDNCESMGSQQGQRKLGTWGIMSSHSLYFGHHLSTIEGGLITTDYQDLAELLRMFRSHGWARDLGSVRRKELKDLWNVDDFNELYTFYVPGFNLRSTDLQAFIGLLQLERLEGIRENRFENFKLYTETLKYSGLWVPKYTWFDYVSNFAYPVISEDRDWIVRKLGEIGVESRPLIAGSMGEQPFFVKEYGGKFLPNANRVTREGFYVPNHPDLTAAEIKKICRVITNKGR